MRSALTIGILLVGLTSPALLAVGAEPAKEGSGTSNPSATSELGVDLLASADLKTRWQLAVRILEADLKKAKADFEIAKVTKQEYVDGVYLQQKQTAESEVLVTTEQARRAQVDLEHLKATADREKVSARELEEKAFALEQAKMRQMIAKTKLQVLEKLSKLRILAHLDRDIRAAEERLKILELRYAIALEGLKQVEAQAGAAKPTGAPKSGAAPIDK